MILEATHSHLYPGNRGRISGPVRIADIEAGCDCLVEFADGSAATARMTKSANGWQLHTDAYRSAAGTAIATRRWILRLHEEGEWIEFRILGKAPEDR